MISNDTCRCLGVGCLERETCERYRQIERDANGPVLRWLSHVATMRAPGQGCPTKIKVTAPGDVA